MTERNKIQSVIDGWLKIATAGLGESARERVRAEIEAHGRETCEALMAEGAAPAEALQTMLLSLGDPRAARRSLARIHLTAEQEEYLNKLTRPRRWRTLEAWICALTIGFPAVFWLIFQDISEFLTGTIAIVAIIVITGVLTRAEQWVLRDQPPRRLLDLLILCRFLEFMFYTVVIACLWWGYRQELPVGWIYFILAVYALWPLAQIAPIRWKLGKTGRSEGPERRA